MVLIILSVIMGYIGAGIGGLFGAEIFVFFFGIVGILSPGLFILEQIYKEITKK